MHVQVVLINERVQTVPILIIGAQNHGMEYKSLRLYMYMYTVYMMMYLCRLLLYLYTTEETWNGIDNF